MSAFFGEEMGIPVNFAISREPGVKPDNQAVRELIKTRAPLVLYGSYNERLYAAETGARCAYIPASFPGAIIRRATGTPFMGYAGATYLIQEYCNAMFDALFHILPLSTQMDSIAATPVPLPYRWDDEALALLDEQVSDQPFLLRISAAKRLREQVEAAAREAGETHVTHERAAAALQLEGVR
jgi:chlorophyllide a reductase subunit Z